jgi:trehalose-phosphatase
MPPSIFEHLSALEPLIASTSSVLMVVDFDALTPDHGRLPAPTWEALQRFAVKEGVTVAIMSGRHSRAEHLDWIAIPGAYYAGNHGLEISGPGCLYIEPTAASQREVIRELAEDLATRFQAFDGVHIDDRGLSIGVLANGADDEEIRRLVHCALAAADYPFHLTTEHQSYEVRPRIEWNQGDAVRWIRRRHDNARALPIYVGADEDVLRSLSDGLTIRVGATGETAAKYALARPPDFDRLLDWLTRRA